MFGILIGVLTGVLSAYWYCQLENKSKKFTTISIACSLLIPFVGMSFFLLLVMKLIISIFED